MDAASVVYHQMRGDRILQNEVFSHASLQRGLDLIAQRYGAGSLAYSPEMRHHFQAILERVWQVECDESNHRMAMPHFDILSNKQMQQFYGVQNAGGLLPASAAAPFGSARESDDDKLARVLDAAAAEASMIASGLAAQQQIYENEDWARLDLARNEGYTHTDLNRSLLRMPDSSVGYTVFDTPIATNQGRHNVIDLIDDRFGTSGGAAADSSAAMDISPFGEVHPGWLL